MANRPLKKKLEIFQSENPRPREKKQTSPFTTLVGVELALTAIVLMILWWAYA